MNRLERWERNLRASLPVIEAVGRVTNSLFWLVFWGGCALLLLRAGCGLAK